MAQFELYRQVVMAFWSLLDGSFYITMYACATMLGINAVCRQFGIEPYDLGLLREIGEKLMDKITAPVSRKIATPNSATRTDRVLHALVVAGITISFTTLFQLITIPAAAGASIASAHLLGSTFSVTTVSLHLVAISMLLALGLFTHINGQVQEGMRYA